MMKNANEQKYYFLAVTSSILLRQAAIVGILLPVIYFLHGTSRSLLFFGSGGMVMMGVVFLFSIFSEILLRSEAAHEGRALYAVLLLPLRLGLFLVPFLLMKLHGKESLFLFSCGIVVGLLPLFFCSRPKKEEL